MTKFKLKIAAILLLSCGAVLSACGEKPSVPVVEEASIGTKLIDQAQDLVNQINQAQDQAKLASCMRKCLRCRQLIWTSCSDNNLQA